MLLRRLREVMAEPVTAQDKLDRIVVLIAANMVAEVCSTYVLRVDGELELYATEGLNPQAVHQTTLGRGEGLVGLVASAAEPLNISDAQNHPAFSYKPETGEEIYHSFLGVPILRAGNTLGVLVVQNKAHRTYSEEEVEALQTTAMVLAEMIASGELTSIARPGAEPAVTRPLHATGVPLAEGIALGYAVLHEPRTLATENLIAEDVTKEVARLDESVDKLRVQLDELLSQDGVAPAGEHRDVLEAFRMFAHDRGWVRRMREAVLQGLTAEAAVERVQSDTRARMLRATDPYIRERLHDLDDLANRLLRILTGREHGPVAEMPDNAILVARSMAPAALLDYDRTKLRGLIIEEAGPTSHVTIIARALGIASVAQIQNIVSMVEAGDALIVDGGTGDVHVRPPVDVQKSYADKVKLRARRQAQYQKLRDKPAITKDGTTISLMLNGGLLVDLPYVEETGASGIGLFRTELQFMVSPTLPRAGEQEELYRSVLDAAGDKPVIFRTLDIGGDKVLPYLRTVEEENPALGWRAIRFGLDRPGLLRSQVRALARAAAGRTLRVMFPMIAAVNEIEEARTIVERELTHLRKWGHQLPERMMLGAMLEVPSLLFELDELLKHVDFISIGSNDLIQFMYAADRGNSRVADRFDPISPAMMRAFKLIIDSANKAGKPATVCGELAARPAGALALIGLGFRHLSVSPVSIGPLKAMIRDINIKDAEAAVMRIVEGDESGRDTLTQIAESIKLS
ncbi:phosphoenolpyruvate--protein phosphotransferase [Terrihabitans soli]|uniref:phosphoenolpyruvate--protein phosphotransferase n=1 Tax=Terrihabitans soli TaxID=708113 RepID=A0A6S6QR37_9HYPH|nr:phosphoenolpyruvate--protein phosphotransferase [Terrihabitans soli]